MPIHSLTVFITLQSVNLLQGLLPNPDEGVMLKSIHLERLYVFSIMWSIGAILELDDRVKLEIFMRENVELDLPFISEDSGNTIFEFFVSDAGEVVCLFVLERVCVLRVGMAYW